MYVYRTFRVIIICFYITCTCKPPSVLAPVAKNKGPVWLVKVIQTMICAEVEGFTILKI